MRLYAIRHGDKMKGDYFNPLLRHEDPPLSEIGHGQARLLPAYFDGRGAPAIYASVYRRAQETARPLSEYFGRETHVDARLNEIDNGVIEPLAEEEIARQYPEFWRDYLSHATDYRFPGGETGAEVRQRQEHLLGDLVERDEDAVLVSHEGWIRLLMCTVLGLPVYLRYRFGYDFCGITELIHSGHEWRIARFNQVTYPKG